MKRKQIQLLKNKRFVTGLLAVAIAAVIGGVAVVQRPSEVPDIPSYTDPIMVSEIEDEETPLASASKVDTKVTTKTSKKKVKMKKASKKTYTKTLPETSSTSKKTTRSSGKTVVTQTTAVKAVTEKYTKKSKVKVVTTTTTTTVTTTTTESTSTSVSSGNSVTMGSGSNSSADTIKGTVDIGQIAPNADSRVITAYRTLGFTVEVDPSVSYSGYFDGRNQKITLKKADDTIYHELGHFVAFVAGNVDVTTSFKNIYNEEKSLYTAYNKAYVTQDSSEYFAESIKELTLKPAVLKSARPKTYEAVSAAVDKLTDAQVTKIKKMYSVIWK